MTDTRPQTLTDAQYVVHCVNAHDDLLEALQASLGCFDYKATKKWPKVYAAGLAAIAKAQGLTL